MNQLISFLHVIYTNKNFHFYFFTLLSLLAFVITVPFFHIQSMLASVNLQSYKIFSLISENQSLLKFFYELFLSVEFMAIILSFISYWCKLYWKELQIFPNLFITTGYDFILIMQISYSLGIIDFDFFTLSENYIYIHSFSSFLLLFVQFINCGFLFLTYLGYFFYTFHRGS